MKISIVTPSFNSAEYIRDTILSVKHQTYGNFEHIVIDGASEDGTLSILEEFPHLVVISEKDKGQSEALNKGFKIASGDILAWQNADDVYLSETFEIVARFFMEHPNVDIVYGYYQLIDGSGNWLCDVFPRKWSKWFFVHGRFCPVQPTVFWRRTVAKSVGELNEHLHYCMDVDFYSRAIKKNFEFQRIPKLLGKFRVHQQSKTQDKKNETKVYQEYKKVLSFHFNYNFWSIALFELFQQRAKLAKYLKLNWLKKI